MCAGKGSWSSSMATADEEEEEEEEEEEAADDDDEDDEMAAGVISAVGSHFNTLRGTGNRGIAVEADMRTHPRTCSRPRGKNMGH